MKSHDYEHPGQIVSGIEWSMPPQPPRRRCETCPTLLRQSNPGTMCAVCERKAMRREAAKRVRPRTESLNERLLRYQRESA